MKKRWKISRAESFMNQQSLFLDSELDYSSKF